MQRLRKEYQRFTRAGCDECEWEESGSVTGISDSSKRVLAAVRRHVRTTGHEVGVSDEWQWRYSVAGRT